MQFKELISNIEQLELALEHIKKGDPNNARYALMLTDNVIELTFHHAAKDKETEIQWKSQSGKVYEHSLAMQEAVGRRFDSKVKFAQILGIIDQAAIETINRCHRFRNELYHVGLQHEPIILELAKFYLFLVCDILSNYNPQSLNSSDLRGQAPEKIQKYFPLESFGFFPRVSQYRTACLTIKDLCAFKPSLFFETLSQHMDEVIDDADIAIDTLVGKRPNITRADWIKQNYPGKSKHDPIEQWRKRANSIRSEKNPHTALKKYCDFMNQTSGEREILDKSKFDFEIYIEMDIQIIRESK